VLLTAAVLVAACGGTGFITLGPPECVGSSEPEMCEQALEAIVTELGDSLAGRQIRIDPVQCAHGACWTFAFVRGPGGGGDQQLSIDWLPNGEVSISYVVGH
jgi:hypothetical protein